MLTALRNFIQKRSTFANPEPWFRETLGIESTSAGVDVSAEGSLRASAVWACVRVLSQSVAGLPLHVYRRDGDNRERAHDHPLYQVLHLQPNRMQTSYEFRQLVMVHLLLWGNSFVEIVRDAAGNVSELWALRPDRVNVRAKDGLFVYEYLTPGGGRVEIPFDRVCHLKGLSTDGLLGLSPISAARQSIGLSMVAERFGAEYFGKGSRVGGVITSPNVVKDEQRQSLTNAWNSRHAGPDGFHSIAIMDAGMTFTPLAISNSDAQFLETRRFSLEEIARMFGLNPSKIGDNTHATYSNVDAFDRSFVKDSIMPWTCNIEQALSVKLLGPRQRNTHFIEFDLNGMLRGDPESQMRQFQAGIYSGILSPNDCRRFLNLNPREAGDQYLQPVNLAPSPFDPSKQNQEPKQ